MLALCHAEEALFHAVWFIESRATHVLVVFMIRIPPNHLKSRPNFWPSAFPLMVMAVAVVLPCTPAGVHLDFAAPPASFFLSLIAMLLAYLLAVEGVKKRSSTILPRSEEAMIFPDPG